MGVIVLKSISGIWKLPLTPREIQVLRLVADGKSAKEIADLLHISKRTVDEHVKEAAEKLGAENRVHVVALALRCHIID
jgi:LuxR family quorum sensing-dependent transcriptional regulator